MSADIGDRLADARVTLGFVGDEIMRLRSECEALRKDAERLDWLFCKLNDDVIEEKCRRVSDMHATGGLRGIRIGDFRAAIDAAIAQERGT